MTQQGALDADAKQTLALTKKQLAFKKRELAGLPKIMRTMSLDSAAAYVLALQSDIGHLPSQLMHTCVEHGWGSSACWGMMDPSVAYILSGLTSLHVSAFSVISDIYRRQLQTYKNALFDPSQTPAGELRERIDTVLTDTARLVGCPTQRLSKSCWARVGSKTPHKFSQFLL